MSSGLIKFAGRSSGGDERGSLHWGRAQIDGAPFRGRAAPNYTQEEFEERTVRISDPKNGTFDTGKPEQNKAYLDVLDKISNGWAALLWIERHRPEGCNHYWVNVEWLEYYLEDGTPTQQRLGAQGHGQPGIAGPFG